MNKALPVDRFGRKINYLRLSVTDRCNLDCMYCKTDNQMLPREQIMTLEEIAFIASVAYEIGFEAVKITGGEPLLRRNIIWLIDKISKIPFKDISVTTNGINLEKFAKDLKDAGLKRITVSLDSLNDCTYKNITNENYLKNVIKGIDEAIDVFGSVKLNTVLMKNINENEVEDFLNLIIDKPVDLRFIELIPNNGHKPVSTKELKGLIDKKLELSQTSNNGYGPAKIYKSNGVLGTVGFISLKENEFCSNCNRLRVKANGEIRPCLYSDEKVNLLDAARSQSKDKVKKALSKAINIKPEKYKVLKTHMRAHGG